MSNSNSRAVPHPINSAIADLPEGPGVTLLVGDTFAGLDQILAELVDQTRGREARAAHYPESGWYSDRSATGPALEALHRVFAAERWRGLAYAGEPRGVRRVRLTLNCLLSNACGPPGPLFVLAEIERGLRYRDQIAFVREIQAACAARPTLRVVCTTYSPYAVDAFGHCPERVYAVHNGRARRFVDHPLWGFLDCTIGEFWGEVGEEWVTEPEPASPPEPPESKP